MAATLVVFQNENERSWMCADQFHDWNNQKLICGSETQKLVDNCEKLFKEVMHNHHKNKDVERKLLSKIYGIAKSHGLRVTWYGHGVTCMPDRFLISGHGHERLAFIQC